jgi:hypothetical protein
MLVLALEVQEFHSFHAAVVPNQLWSWDVQELRQRLLSHPEYHYGSTPTVSSDDRNLLSRAEACLPKVVVVGDAKAERVLFLIDGARMKTRGLQYSAEAVFVKVLESCSTMAVSQYLRRLGVAGWRVYWRRERYLVRLVVCA